MGHGQDSYAAPFPSSSRRHRKSALHVAAVEESELTLTRDRPGVDELQEAQTPLLQDAAVEAGNVEVFLAVNVFEWAGLTNIFFWRQLCTEPAGFWG